MRLHVASWVRSAALRIRCLSLAKTCSMGFRSGLEQQARANAPDCVADSGTPVDGEIIHDGDIACKECGDEALLDIIEEAITVDWLIQDKRCVDPVAA